MMILNQIPHEVVVSFGRDLLNGSRDQFGSFEEAAQASAQAIYDGFRQPDGSAMFALVRIYRLCRREEMPPDVQAFIGDYSGERWMALMGTVGDEPAWCDRHQSR